MRLLLHSRRLLSLKLLNVSLPANKPKLLNHTNHLHPVSVDSSQAKHNDTLNQPQVSPNPRNSAHFPTSNSTKANQAVDMVITDTAVKANTKGTFTDTMANNKVHKDVYRLRLLNLLVLRIRLLRRRMLSLRHRVSLVLRRLRLLLRRHSLRRRPRNIRLIILSIHNIMFHTGLIRTIIKCTKVTMAVCRITINIRGCTGIKDTDLTEAKAMIDSVLVSMIRLDVVGTVDNKDKDKRRLVSVARDPWCHNMEINRINLRKMSRRLLRVLLLVQFHSPIRRDKIRGIRGTKAVVEPDDTVIMHLRARRILNIIRNLSMEDMVPNNNLVDIRELRRINLVKANRRRVDNSNRVGGISFLIDSSFSSMKLVWHEVWHEGWSDLYDGWK